MSTVSLSNPHLCELHGDDHMHHFGFTRANTDFVQQFGDVKFVCTGGSATRMKRLAESLDKALPPALVVPGSCNVNMCHTDRYVMYKVGPVLCVNHGMGMPSISVMLNEVIKLLHYARCKDVTLFRLGTSGGLGVEVGTVVLAERGVNGMLRSTYMQHVLGEEIEWPANFDNQLRNSLISAHEAAGFQWPIATGNTFSTDDFYEGQARLDGAFCTYGPAERTAFLERLRHEHGVLNIEMESVALGALTMRAGLRSALVCVTLLDRLLPQGDQVLLTHEQMVEFEQRPCQLVIAYITRRLQAAAINCMDAK